MLKPFYQGKLDTFCAIYAVINAFRLIHAIRTTTARSILNETLTSLASNPDALKAVLNQTTDYVPLVDGMLRSKRHTLPLEVIQPFGKGEDVGVDAFWECCRSFFEGEGPRRGMIFRFARHMNMHSAPLANHWTTADSCDGTILHLFDSSHDAEAILNIRKEHFVTRTADLDASRLIVIQPPTLRLLRAPF
jgi:hypothetical protein